MLAPLPRSRHHLLRRLHRHLPRPHPRQLLRPRLRLPSRLVARCRKQLAAWHPLSALGAKSQLRRRRAALRLLSAAHLDAGRSARPDLPVEGRSARHSSVPSSPRPGLPRARWRARHSPRPRNPGRMRRALLRLLPVHRLRALCFRRTRRRLLDSAASAARLPRSQSARLRLWRRAFDGSAVLLALVIAGAWLSNAPLGVMACYLLAAVALLVALLRRSWAPILRAVGCGRRSASACPPSTLFPPRSSSDGSRSARPPTIPAWRLKTAWLFGRHADPNLELHDVELWTRLHHRRHHDRPGAASASSSLATRHACRANDPGGFRSRSFPSLSCFCNFPFRCRSGTCFPSCVFCNSPGAGSSCSKRRSASFSPPPSGLTTPLAARRSSLQLWRSLSVDHRPSRILFFHQPCDAEDTVAGMLGAYRSGQGFEGTDEYAPPGADNRWSPSDCPMPASPPIPALVLGIPEDGNTPQWDPAHGHCDATYAWLHRITARSRRSTAPRRRQPRTPATSSCACATTRPGRFASTARPSPRANPILTLPQRDDGLMAVPVPQGPCNSTVDWTTTPDVIIGRWLSYVARAALCSVSSSAMLELAVERRLKPNLG